MARRVVAGDEHAFVELMRQHNRMLYRAARSILRDEAESEDAVQEAYLVAYRQMGGFRGASKLSTWLVRIVVNEALGRLRKRDRGLRLALALEGAAVTHPTASQSAERGAQGAQALRILQVRIDALPDTLRVVFMLRGVEDMSVEEVSAALDVPKATVRTRYFRARRLLRASLPSELQPRATDAFAFAGARCRGMVAAVLARVREYSFPRLSTEVPWHAS